VPLPRPVSAGTPSAPESAERQLLARIQAGDPSAFEDLFKAHYEGMCALAYSFVRSRDSAEDIVSNVFRSLWTRRMEWEPRGPAQTYLLTATRNEAINLLRRLRRERGLEERVQAGDAVPALAGPSPTPDSAVLATELTADLERAAARLPARCREVFLLRWREGLRSREIAERMGISLKTVEMQMTRAFRALRETMARHR
jgi:RNA polymerase sigma-70 factor, ECF subfamily